MNKAFCQAGLNVIEIQAKALLDLSQRIDENFAEACQLLLSCQGRLIIIGMGKSGHIGKKLAATFASTGSPAFFVHAAEAGHGDMGMITKDDVVIAISNSGFTPEILTLVPALKRQNIPIVALTGDKNSPIALAAKIHLDVSVTQEACPLGLAPTTSTTAALVMGDALAIALLQTRGFTQNDFARYHPSGLLGRRLSLLIDDLMVSADRLPIVGFDTILSEALIEVTEKKRGMTTVVDNEGQLLGVFTDGDLRRTINNNIDIHKTPIHLVMTKHCKTVKLGLLASEALAMMEKHRISVLVIVNDENHPIGLVHMYDLLNAGIV